MTDRVLDARYRLIELLGSGGMGEVWRCHDPRIGRDVAVKVLLDVRVTDESLARFDRDARVAGRLASPFIVSVHDYGHGALDGRVVPYLVMELVDGETLDQVMARELAMSRLLDIPRALRWTDQVCAAGWCSAPRGTCRRNRPRAGSSTTGRICTRWAAFCTSC